MKKISKKLKRWFYIEPIGIEYFVWYARFVTVPIFGVRYTVIYGLDFEVFTDIKLATDYLNAQKRIYKLALTLKYRR